ncbi:C39 family peptidase [Solicola sp. PLA-1-18]|uniref:C39 family peptidase n=1 Tax=Solicola sp. PLA-1-18 TaxID=3380532 RepID=UPI003B810631
MTTSPLRRSAALLLAAGVAAGLLTSSPARTDAATSTGDRHVTLVRDDSRRDFARGSADGLVTTRGGGLAVSPRERQRTSYTDPYGDGTARSYEYGTWTSPVRRLSYGATEAIASWNATTPTGTWVETTFRGRTPDGSWTKWYVLGRWTSGMAAADIHRTSVDGQGDDDATVYTDTFAARDGRQVDAYQTRVRLLRPAGSRATPTLDGLATMTSAVPDGPLPTTSRFTLGRAVELDVPRFSQNIHKGEYPEFGGGGQVWCSPTSTSMVQYYWRRPVPAAELRGIETNAGDPQVPYAAMHTWDFAYDGAGNWPFNAAYAHRFGLEAFVTRLGSLADVERFVARGIPVVVSLSWKEAEMPEAGYGTNGHLMVVVGFTADGDPVLNDPASSSDQAVRNVYTRENFEKVWIGSTGGVSYVYAPPGVRLPPHHRGDQRAW